MILAFLSEYHSARTRNQYYFAVRSLFLSSGAPSPSHLQPGDVVAWATALTSTGRPPSNNTVRSRLIAISAFLTWCLETGIPAPRPSIVTRLRKAFPPVYGKKQGTHPARFLTHGQAAQLIAACQDGTLRGLRDEIVIRLGLAGMRNAEIRALTFRSLDETTARPTFAWMGKHNRPRQARASRGLMTALSEYRTLYETAIRRPIRPDDPVMCPMGEGERRARVQFGKAVTRANEGAVNIIVKKRAADAGLGHVAPHDLRRTCAAILHRTRINGMHQFDLLDIQQVLGHADPATTMRSYLEQIDAETLDAAADVLDW